MRPDSLCLRCEAEREGDLEGLERAHLAVEPGLGVRAEAVGPAHAGAEMANAKLLQPRHGLIEPVILEVQPLADAERRRVVAELLQGTLGSAVLPEQAHVEMAVVRRA